MKVINHTFSSKNNLVKFIKKYKIDDKNTTLQLFYKIYKISKLNGILELIEKKLPNMKIISSSKFDVKDNEIILSFIIFDKKRERKNIKKVKKTNLRTQYEKEIKKINTLLDQYKKVVDYSSIISKTDLNGKITYANDKFCKVSGYSYNELIGKNHNIVRAEDTPREMYAKLWEDIQNKKTWQGVLKNKAKTGQNYYVESTVMPILDEEGNIIEYIALRHDISEVMNPKKQIVEKLKTLEKPLLIMLKIEDFEMLEDFYEHSNVETIEESLSLQIFDFFPKEYTFDKIYKLGNGEFALLREVVNSNYTINDHHQFLRKLQKNVADAKIILNDYEYDISVNISYSIGKKGAFENTKYGLKKATKESLDIVYANDLVEQKQKQALHNINIIKMVKTALHEEKIISYFQPIMCNKTNKIKKYESLVRLIDQENNVITPYHFLDISKKGKYYIKITDTVLDQSLKLLDKYDTDVSINLSTIDIENGYIKDKITRLLQENIKNSSRIVFELLEDENAKNFEEVFDFIAFIKSFGAKIAIDDFGAGYSNFNRLLEYQPDILKIDGSLIKNIENDHFSRSVVETIQEFANKQNISTIAEFVSSEKILEIVNKIGINYSQGFHIGKPSKIL